MPEETRETERKVALKTSSDCIRLNLCPYSQEIFDEMEINCEESPCDTCKYCPVTCGHWADAYNRAIGDSGEYETDCDFYAPHSLKHCYDLRWGVFWTMMAYDEGSTTKSAIDVLKEIAEHLGFNFDGLLAPNPDEGPRDFQQEGED